VIFVSAADNLTTNDNNDDLDIFPRDRVGKQTTLVSVNASGESRGRGASVNPILSSNNQWVAFQSAADNLVTNDHNHCADIFRRDLAARKTTLISVNRDSAASGNAESVNPQMTPDGRWIVFESAAGDLTANDTNGCGDVFVRDVLGGSTILTSVNRTGTNSGNDVSDNPSISADGRWIAFESAATDLVENDTNAVRDVFVRGLQTGTTLWASLNRDGTGSGNGYSGNPILSADGRTVAFTSWASDLVPGDRNHGADVFVLRLGSGDSDGDGMDDDWEMTFFGNLNRDGTGDFDGDGLSDLAEFQAGTNPIDNTSVLRVITLTAINSGLTEIFWTAVPGKVYAVEYKNAIGDAAWTRLPGDVAAIGTTASKTDDSVAANAHRFYRVILLPQP
jgi:hypothetical protein